MIFLRRPVTHIKKHSKFTRARVRVHIPTVKTILSDAVFSTVCSLKEDRQRSISHMTRVAQS